MKVRLKGWAFFRYKSPGDLRKGGQVSSNQGGGQRVVKEFGGKGARAYYNNVRSHHHDASEFAVLCT